MNYKEIIERNDINTTKYFYIPKSNGRRLVIGDIHGCVLSFKALLSKVALTKSDQLFLVGDYINKGKSSRDVIDTILYLIDEDYQIFPLRGNHEEILLDRHFALPSHLPVLFRAKGLVDEDKKILSPYLPFFYHLPYYFELDNFYIVHGGFDFQSPDPLNNYGEMAWIRDFEIDKKIVGNKKIIHGHTPELIMMIKDDIEKNRQKICIDNGCVYKHKWFLGSLLCLDLDSLLLYEQPNIDNDI
ncbi:MAG: metallophosphoesterase [Thermoflexibacter sp.]|jgi:serine/threonine protein phosphatase 1|nr:metallophosphoesterase [Thermoflexibacter sp.]